MRQSRAGTNCIFNHWQHSKTAHAERLCRDLENPVLRIDTTMLALCPSHHARYHPTYFGLNHVYSS